MKILIAVVFLNIIMIYLYFYVWKVEFYEEVDDEIEKMKQTLDLSGQNEEILKKISNSGSKDLLNKLTSLTDFTKSFNIIGDTIDGGTDLINLLNKRIESAVVFGDLINNKLDGVVNSIENY